MPEPGAAGRDEAASWVGYPLDDASRVDCGRIAGLYTDAESDEPAWLVAELPAKRTLWRRRPPLTVVIPYLECAGGGGRVWTALSRGAIRTAPVVDPRRPLLREHEIGICAHYGIGPEIGRAAAVVGRQPNAVTARPAGRPD